MSDRNPFTIDKPKPQTRNVRLHAVGEYVLVRIMRGETMSPGGVIIADYDKADLTWGRIVSVGQRAKEEKYGPAVRPGQLIVFPSKAGVKIDAETKIISIDEVFAAEDVADAESAPTETVQ